MLFLSFFSFLFPLLIILALVRTAEARTTERARVKSEVRGFLCCCLFLSSSPSSSLSWLSWHWSWLLKLELLRESRSIIKKKVTGFLCYCALRSSSFLVPLLIILALVMATEARTTEREPEYIKQKVTLFLFCESDVKPDQQQQQLFLCVYCRYHFCESDVN